LAYNADPTTAALLEKLEWNPMSVKDYVLSDGLLFHQGHILVVTDPDIQHEILLQCHDTLAAGHFGIQKTFKLMSQTYEWPKLRSFVKEYVSTCDTCLWNKTS